MKMRFILSLLGVAGAGAAHASSEDAWVAFRAEVAKACLAVPDAPKDAVVEVSPFGSETYGAALVTSIAEGALVRQVCIFDKANHKAELAAPFEAAP